MPFRIEFHNHKQTHVAINKVATLSELVRFIRATPNASEDQIRASVAHACIVLAVAFEYPDDWWLRRDDWTLRQWAIFINEQIPNAIGGIDH